MCTSHGASIIAYTCAYKTLREFRTCAKIQTVTTKSEQMREVLFAEAGVVV